MPLLQNINWQERLRTANYLNSIAYNYIYSLFWFAGAEFDNLNQTEMENPKRVWLKSEARRGFVMNGGTDAADEIQ